MYLTTELSLGVTMKAVLFSFVIFAALLISSTAIAASKESAQSNNSFDAQLAADMAAHRYATAGTMLDTPEKLAKPKYLLAYTRLAVDDYAMTINFRLFALKDLAPGETVASIRGKPGQYKIMRGDLEDILHMAYQQKPDDPQVNYAVGYYLSRSDDCGCATFELFKGAASNDATYFLRAEQGGVKDAWSLFRIGVYYQQQDPPDLGKAQNYYSRSLKLDPHNVDARYDLASTLLAKKQLVAAAAQAKLALDGYSDPKLNADTHALYCTILYAQGKLKEAETQCWRALALQDWHPQAFSILIQILRKRGQDKQYEEEVLKYIGLDYSNTFTFNVYMETLDSIGFSPVDARVEKSLLALKLSDKETGPLYFNLGKMAEMQHHKQEALRRYRISLAAMQRLPKPPHGAIDALNQLIAQLQSSP